MSSRSRRIDSFAIKKGGNLWERIYVRKELADVSIVGPNGREVDRQSPNSFAHRTRLRAIAQTSQFILN